MTEKDSPFPALVKPRQVSGLRISIWLALLLLVLLVVTGLWIGVAQYLKWRNENLKWRNNPIPESDWREFTPPPFGDIKVQVPAAPDSPRLVQVAGLNGTQNEIAWEKAMVFTVEQFYRDHDRAGPTPREFMVAHRKLNLVEMTRLRAKVASEQEIKFGHHAGWEYKLEGDKDVICVARLYLVKLEREDMIVVLSFFGRGRQIAAATTFFDSLQIVEERGDGAR
jgi:hypothetical protein